MSCAFSVGRLQRLHWQKLVIWRTIPQFKLCLHFNKMIQEIRTFSRRAAFGCFSVVFFFLSFCCHSFGANFSVVLGVQVGEKLTSAATSKLSNWLIVIVFGVRSRHEYAHQHFARHDTKRHNIHNMGELALALNNPLINQLMFSMQKTVCAEFRARALARHIYRYL